MDNAMDIQSFFTFHGEKFQVSVQTLMYKGCKMYKIKIKASLEVTVWILLKLLLLGVMFGVNYASLS